MHPETTKKLILTSITFVVMPLLYKSIQELNLNSVTFHTLIDDAIPFVPLFGIPYLLYYCLLMLVYYKYWNLEYNKFEHIAFSFLLIDIIAFLFYALYQTYTIRHEDPTFIVPFIYSIDHATNAFPSLHVANTILAYTTIKDLTMHKKYLTILCISIILSTVLIKQHAFLDVIGGIILSVIVIKYYYSTQYGKLWTVAEKYEVKKVK